MGLCRSYDEVEKIDSALAQRTISRAGLNHVPVPPSIQPKVLIQGAMDNFDHEENTKSGTDGSHDTILMLFQNRENNVENNVNGISVRHGATNEKKALNEMLHCQKLIRAGKLGNRGQIPENFLPGEPYKAGDTKNSSNLDYPTWIMTRYVTKSHLPEYSSCEKPSIPSFTATNSVLDHTQHPLTNIAFTPIIPYPATEYNTINTCMRNFQDVLSQNDLEYSLLWCDEGVYRIAKELQLLNPEGFNNIFLGLGGFHLEKILIACAGKFLEESGVENVFVENEIFGPGVVKTVMNGGHYVRGKRGMTLISEALHRLQISQFIETNDCLQFQSLFEKIGNVQELFQAHDLHIRRIQKRWKECKELLGASIAELMKYKEAGKLQSDQFKYCCLLLDEIMPILRDLTRSHREGDWKLHISAVRRALPLFFWKNKLQSLGTTLL